MQREIEAEALKKETDEACFFSTSSMDWSKDFSGFTGFSGFSGFGRFCSFSTVLSTEAKSSSGGGFGFLRGAGGALISGSAFLGSGFSYNFV